MTSWIKKALALGAAFLAMLPQSAKAQPSGGAPPAGGGSGSSSGSGSGSTTGGSTGGSTGPSGGSGVSTGGVTTAPARGPSTGSSGSSGTGRTNSSYGSGDTYLPSSSRMNTDASRSSDGFDFGGSSGGNAVVRGNSDAVGVLTPSAYRVPNNHTVKRGDTLWDLSGYYYHNPYYWPRIWSYNPQIQNPHWIYPGDRIRLRRDDAPNEPSMSANRSKPASGAVFLRDRGYVDDEKKDVLGEISGSPEDKMLLSDGDFVYITAAKDQEFMTGQELQVFRSLRSAPGAKGAVVQVFGTVRITDWDRDRRVARGRILESLDAIERGAKVGPVGRKFDIVPPTKNNNDVVARVVVAIEPVLIYGRDQVVYIDKGQDDGLAPGNRLFIVRKGDQWRPTLKGSGDLSDQAPKKTTETGDIKTESIRGTERDKDYPDEIVGELRVLRTREKTSACLVTSSRIEISQGDYAIARRGY